LRAGSSPRAQEASLVEKSKDEWRAWYNVMPGSPHVLHVVGKIDVGDVDQDRSLTNVGEEKSNPPNLLLQLGSKEILVPRDAGDHVIEVRYTEQASPGRYGTIKVKDPSGALITEITEITEITVAS